MGRLARAMICGVDHLGLTAPDLEEAVAFLEAAFDCTALYHIGPVEVEDD
ncbi:MAG: hypothetical protein AAGC81_08815 [Pseudomonadota bacterium]